MNELIPVNILLTKEDGKLVASYDGDTNIGTQFDNNVRQFVFSPPAGYEDAIPLIWFNNGWKDFSPPYVFSGPMAPAQFPIGAALTKKEVLYVQIGYSSANMDTVEWSNRLKFTFTPSNIPDPFPEATWTNQYAELISGAHVGSIGVEYVGNVVVLTYYNVNRDPVASVSFSTSGQSSGDMEKIVYDPRNLQRDVYAYTDEAVQTGIGSLREDVDAIQADVEVVQTDLDSFKTETGSNIEALQESVTDINGRLSSHVQNTTVHVTQTDKDKWNGYEATITLHTGEIITLQGDMTDANALITALRADVAALSGAVVYLGLINLNTADVTQEALTARANEILAGQPLKTGHTLIDLDRNDWMYNTDNTEWVNIGYSDVSVATTTTLGVVLASTNHLEVAVAATGVMTVNGLSTVLSELQAAIVPSDWDVNDEAQPGYIKNRPFYRYGSLDWLFEEAIDVTAGDPTYSAVLPDVVLHEGRSYQLHVELNDASEPPSSVQTPSWVAPWDENLIGVGNAEIVGQDAPYADSLACVLYNKTTNVCTFYTEWSERQIVFLDDLGVKQLPGIAVPVDGVALTNRYGVVSPRIDGSTMGITSRGLTAQPAVDQAKEYVNTMNAFKQENDISISTSAWVLNQDTGFYEFNVTDDGVTGNTLINGYFPYDQWTVVHDADIYVESFNGLFKLISRNTPTEELTFSYRYGRMTDFVRMQVPMERDNWVKDEWSPLWYLDLYDDNVSSTSLVNAYFSYSTWSLIKESLVSVESQENNIRFWAVNNLVENIYVNLVY